MKRHICSETHGNISTEKFFPLLENPSFFFRILIFIFLVLNEGIQLLGILDLDMSGTGFHGNHGKVIQLQAVEDVADLSNYGLGVANNGKGTHGEEFSFPQISVEIGQIIWVATNETTLRTYFGDCIHGIFVLANNAISQNGKTFQRLSFLRSCN